jgi:hypothetical protein
MRLKPLLVFALLGVTSCMAPKYNSLRERAAAEGMCNDATAQHIVGREATSEAAAAVLQATGAYYFEWIPPDSIVTTGFGPRRVRVTYDHDRKITEIRCG